MNVLGSFMKKTENDSRIISVYKGENAFFELFRGNTCKYDGKPVTVLQVMPGADENTYMVEIIWNEEKKDNDSSKRHAKDSRICE